MGLLPNPYFPLFACMFPNLRPLLPFQGFPSPLPDRDPAPHVGRGREEEHSQRMRTQPAQRYSCIALDRKKVGAQNQEKARGDQEVATRAPSCGGLKELGLPASDLNPFLPLPAPPPKPFMPRMKRTELGLGLFIILVLP